MRTALIAATLCAVLSGCGQKGPLFIPDDDTTQTSTPASQPVSQSVAQPAFSQP